MVNFGALRDEIATDIVRSDIATEIEEAIREAISEFEIDTYTWNQAKDTTRTLIVGDSELAFPTNMFKIKNFKVLISANDKQSLRAKSIEFIEDQDNAGTSFVSRPKFYGVDRELLIVHPRPDQAYSTEILGYATETLPTGSADTHKMITNAKNMVKWKAQSILYFTILFDDTNGAKFEKLAGGPDIENPTTGKLLGAYGREKRKFNRQTQSLVMGMS